MAVNYNSSLKSTRMTDVKNAIDAGSPPGSIEIGTAAMAGVIVAITLGNPSFTENGSGVLTLAATPLSGSASLAGTNTAAAARIKNAAGTVVVSGLTVGVGSGDIQLNSTSITQGQTVTLTSGTITHSA